MADTTTWTPITAPTDFRDDAVFDIDFKTKTVQVLVEQPIVAGENLSQFIKFQAPRFYDNIDLTEMMVNILYVSPAGNKGISAAVNTEYSEDSIRCGWLVPYAACPEKGTLHFVLEFVGADYTLKTTIASTPVLDSINDADVVPEPAEQAWYITLQANVSATLQAAQTALGRIESIFNALSTPTAASEASEMLDESTIYVYTGSETGYTYGDWYYYDGTEWVSGGEYASTTLTVETTPTQGSTNAVSSGGVWNVIADVTDDIAGLKTNTSALPVYYYAGEIAETGNGFVSNAGVVTANSNYKYAKYSLHDGTQKIAVDSMYITGSASNYAVFAFFDASDSFISAVNNRTINSTNTGNTFTDVQADIPLNADYVLITFGNMASSTTFSTITEIGLYKPATNKRVFNNGLNSSNKQFFYFHTTAEGLGDYSSLAFNARFKTESPVLSYEVYFTGYDVDYTNRTFAIYKTGLTKGIDGNTVTIAENFQNTANSLSSKAYIGVVVNFLYAYPSETGARTGISNANLYAVTSEYCMLNDTELELAHYPASGFTTLSTAHTEHYNPLYGGFLCTIGDSLTAVYYKSEAESWTALIAKWNNMQYENKGVSGMPLAKNTAYTERCMCDVVDELSASKFYTHIMVMGGANDYNAHTAIGENSDTEVTTFKGAINHIITTLTQKFPNTHIVFGTTYRRNQAYADKPYADAMMEICALHSIPCLNNYENSGVQFFDENWMTVYGATNALGNNHLNAAGDLFVAPRFEHALKYGIS